MTFKNRQDIECGRYFWRGNSRVEVTLWESSILIAIGRFIELKCKRSIASSFLLSSRIVTVEDLLLFHAYMLYFIIRISLDFVPRQIYIKTVASYRKHVT